MTVDGSVRIFNNRGSSRHGPVQLMRYTVVLGSSRAITHALLNPCKQTLQCIISFSGTCLRHHVFNVLVSPNSFVCLDRLYLFVGPFLSALAGGS